MTTPVASAPRAPAVRRLVTAAAAARLVDGAKASTFAVLALGLDAPGVTVAVLAMCATVPVVLLGPHVGMLIDRRSPRRASVGALVVQAGILGVTTLVVLVGGAGVPLLVGCALALGVCQAVTDNALNALVPELVGPDRLTAVNGSMTTGQTAARVAGPAAFGVLVVWSPVLTFACWTALTVVALVALRGVTPAVAVDRTGTRPGVLDGLRWIATSPQVLALLVGVTLANVALGAMASVLPLFAVRDLGIPAATYGTAASVMAVTGVLGSLVASRLTRVPRAAALGVARAVQTAGLVVLASSGGPVPLLVGAAVVGLASGAWNVVSSTVLMAEVPAPGRGQVMSTYRSVAFAGSPVGNALGGAAGAVGARGGLVASAVLSLAATVVVLRLRTRIGADGPPH
ncbi:MFS transporter [Cellulomonas fimi]|uniref:MFS transporter n=1 Tax=Cellulomonas fimi TaxID=1708 RepID=UPI0002D3AE63|nr:MFS transporter [Cellulomonas fimi]NNH08137.1 MFS transporter [Cellulomonas fimi]